MKGYVRFGTGISACLALALMLFFQGCSMDAGEDEVRVEIQETLSDSEKESLKTKLSALTTGGSSKSQSVNGKVIFVFGGVSDVKAYAKKIKFAKVVEVREKDRTVVLSVK